MRAIMALVKTSSDIVFIKGQLGGVYFKRSPTGLHVQAMPRVVRYARSPLQQGGFGEHSPFICSGISGFSAMSWIWMMALTVFFSAAWAAYAIAFYFTTRDGEEKRITGYNWFVSYAFMFPEEQHPPFWKPPHAPGDLPDLIVLYKGLWSYEHAPIGMPNEYCTDYYWESRWVYGKPSYVNDDKTWYIWWGDPYWTVSPEPGVVVPGVTFFNDVPDIRGYYRNPWTKKYAHVYLGKPIQ